MSYCARSMASPTRGHRTENLRRSLTLPKLNRDSFGRAIRALHRTCGKHCRKSCEKRAQTQKKRATDQIAQTCGRNAQTDQNVHVAGFELIRCIATCALFRAA